MIAIVYAHIRIRRSFCNHDNMKYYLYSWRANTDPIQTGGEELERHRVLMCEVTGQHTERD